MKLQPEKPIWRVGYKPLEGWKCPGCGHCFPVWIRECPYCPKEESALTDSGTGRWEYEKGTLFE